MARYIITDEETKGVKKALPKYGSIHIENDKIKGGLRVVGYRKYSWGEQVDIEFIGQIKVRYDWRKTQWFDSSVMNDKSKTVSKVKINRFIKRNCLVDLQRNLRYFGVNITDYTKITKVKWL